MIKSKIIIASAVAIGIVGITSALAFANGGGMGFGMGGFGWGFGANFFSNSKIQDALKAKGITPPTQTEITDFANKMRAAMTAESNLSDADKKGLMDLRASFMVQERNYLRSKGIDLPSEADFTKLDQIRDALSSDSGSIGNGFFGHGMMDFGRGMMDGKGGMGMMGRHGGWNNEQNIQPRHGSRRSGWGRYGTGTTNTGSTSTGVTSSGTTSTGTAQ